MMANLAKRKLHSRRRDLCAVVSEKLSVEWHRRAARTSGVNISPEVNETVEIR